MPHSCSLLFKGKVRERVLSEMNPWSETVLPFLWSSVTCHWGTLHLPKVAEKLPMKQVLIRKELSCGDDFYVGEIS